MRDPVEIERQNQHLTESNLRLHRILASLPIPWIGIDTSGRIYEMNDAAQAQFGYEAFEVFEVPLADIVLGPEDRETFAVRLKEAIADDRRTTFELPAVNREGGRLMIEWGVMPMRGVDGDVSSARLIANDITERVMQADKLKDLAFKDALTGLCNRRSFMDVLQASPAHPLSLILMDVDRFKNYNDTYGHPAGDTLLRRIGDLLVSNLSAPYLPARYGGEEFVVLLPGTDTPGAFEIAEMVRTIIHDNTQDLHGATVSLGVATAGAKVTNTAELIEQADQALYCSKHEGRNRTSIWSEQLAA